MKVRVAILLLCFIAGLAGAETAANQYPFAKGKIERLNAAAHSITVTTPTGPKNFAITDQTYVIAGGERVAFEKLKIGDLVAINYVTNSTGQAQVRRLKIKPAE